MQVDPNIQKLSGQYFLIVYSSMLARAAMIIFGTVLRAAGDSKTPMRVGLLVNIVNVVLNFLLIFESRSVDVFGFKLWIPGAGIGVIGAAIASSAAFWIGGVVITVLLYRHREISPKGRSIKPNGEVLRPCLRASNRLLKAV